MPRLFNYEISVNAPSELSAIKELLSESRFQDQINEYRATNKNSLKPGESYHFNFPATDEDDE